MRDVKVHSIDVPSQPFPEPSGDCANCHNRPATERWIGDGGSLALSHGHYQFWCKPCCLQVMLDHARERAAAIPDLECELAVLGTVGG